MLEIPNDLRAQYDEFRYREATGWRTPGIDERGFVSVSRLIERIGMLEEALLRIADHGTQPPWGECARIARAALGREGSGK